MSADKTFYLVPYLGVPGNFHPPSRKHIVQANRAARAMGIQVLRIGIQTQPRYSPNQRYFFRFPRFRPDDTKALRICECILYGVAVSWGPFGDPDYPIPVVRIPASMIKGKQEIENDDLEKGAKLIKGQVLTHESSQSITGKVSFIAHFHVSAAWSISRALYENPSLYNGSRFLDSSQHDFFVYPGQIREVASLTEQTAESGREQSILEDALLNAFRAVEAVIGDPPSDNRKFFDKLRSVGVDPKEPVGFESTKRISDVIRDMNRVRDKKSAHGGTPDRDIAVADVLEFQHCARYILICGIEAHLGESIH